MSEEGEGLTATWEGMTNQRNSKSKDACLEYLKEQGTFVLRDEYSRE